MAYKNRLIDKLNLPPRAGLRPQGQKDPSARDITEMMMDPRYLRQSSGLINEGLQKGYDVLQMEDGEVILTGTRTIVHRFRWDMEKGRMLRIEIPVDEDEIRRETILSVEEA